MSKERKLKFYLDSAGEEDDDNATFPSVTNPIHHHQQQHPPSPPDTSPPSEASDSGVDTLPKNASSSTSSSPILNYPDSGRSSGGASAFSRPEKSSRKVSIEDPNPEGEEDSDTSTWVSRNRRNRRRAIGSDSYESASGSFSENPEPLPTRKSSQEVVVEINTVDKEENAFASPRDEYSPRPPQRPRRISRERVLDLPVEPPVPRARRISRETSHDSSSSEASSHHDRSPRLNPYTNQAFDDSDERSRDVVLDMSPHARKTSGGILKNSPDRELVELQDFNQGSRVRKYSREVLGGTPVETIQEDSSELEHGTTLTPPYRNRKSSNDQSLSGGEDGGLDEVVEAPGLTLSDEEFQENYLGNIPANKRKYGVFPPQYRSSNSLSPPPNHPPSAGTRRYRRSVSESAATKRISFDLTNQGLPSVIPDPDDNDDNPQHPTTPTNNHNNTENTFKPRKANGLSSAQSAPDLRLHERYKRARRYSVTSTDTLNSSIGSDVSLSRTVAAHVRRDSIALFSDKINTNPLKRTSQKLVADLGQLRKSHVGILSSHVPAPGKRESEN